MTSRHIAIIVGLLICAEFLLAIGTSTAAGARANLVLPPYKVGEPNYEPD